MMVEMDEPFVWPEAPEDFEAYVVSLLFPWNLFLDLKSGLGSVQALERREWAIAR